MAAATAAVLPTSEISNMDHRSLEGSHRLQPNLIVPPVQKQKPLRPQRSIPSPGSPSSSRSRPVPRSPKIESTARLDSPVIPYRRSYNIEDDPHLGENAASQADADDSIASFSSLSPSQSASQARAQASPRSPRRAYRQIDSKDAHDAQMTAADRKHKSSRKQNLTNLEMASLSTPELHLASDPMIDTHEPSFLRKLGRNSRTNSVDAVSGAGSEGLSTRHGGSRSNDAVATVKPVVAYSSFSAAMNAVESNNGAQRPPSMDDKRSRKHSSATIREDDQSSSAGGSLTPSAAWQNNNVSTDTLRPPRQSGNQTSSASRRSPVNAALSNAGTWFRRQRKNESRDDEEEVDSTVANASERVAANDEESKTQLSLAPSHTSAATAGTGTTGFSDSNLTMLSAATGTSFGMQDLASPQAALDSIRKARSFMIREFSRMSPRENEQVHDRILSLTSQMNVESQDAHVEASYFWSSIADGVLLCTLANRLRPGSVDRIDRRNADWVKADNISRFLRAARDHLGLRSKDLFQTFDLTDCTVEGLLRVVHTLSVVEKAAKRTSKVTVLKSNGFKIEPRTTSMTPPTTPRAQDRKELQAEENDTRNFGDAADSTLDEDTPKRNMLQIQQNRREAERILVSMGRPDSGRVDPAIAALRRRSNELSTNRQKSSSITFADSVKSTSFSSDDEGRLPYRDRKLSESAISLTGVVEEDPEDLAASVETPQPKRTYSLGLTSTEPPLPLRRGSSESEKSTQGLGMRPPPLARTSSQKRISQELALGQLPRSVIGSTENLDDYLFASSASPSRHAPARRHSARLYPGPSLLNPSRESLILQTASGTESDASPSSRLPFPRGTLQNDSPGARKMGRHLSMNAGNMDSFSMASSSSAGNNSSSPKITTRPQFRHMRYSSDLHLPTMQRATSIGGRSPDPSGDERSIVTASRTRFDSEMGSIYTNTLGSLATDEAGSAVGRSGRDAPPPSHKLVVVEEGKPNVTYQLGNCIGRGQFGSVYRALNLNSGQMVAVKRIKLDGRSDDEVTELMNEVDLLKSLTHPSVVKYEGLVRGPDVVSIILEYVENGSLLHTLKAFGNFPERLVASYVVKILEGLNYLHEQNVVHCDLKAANILTTKNGNVKLSDFGVSLNLKAVKKMNNKNDAIGTPNWMAPEVIELKGVTTAADIWSLACTIIELLTGKPPYHDMLAMSAMFRIVEDGCPPIPERCSEPLRDLLLQCFNKDPTKRPSAEMLFEHEWVRQVWSGHRELRPQDSVPFLRRISADMRRLDPRMFEQADQPAQQPAMIRSTSSPPPTLQRPQLDALRSTTSPAESSAGTVIERSPAASPNETPPVHTLTLPNAHELVAGTSGKDETPSSVPVSPTMLSPLMDPSLLDLGLTSGEESKPHAFVKSTFSKAVVCKICREPVKKHAVLCEECGLVCHARCAVKAPSACNLRAQLLLFQQRASVDQTSPVSSSLGHGPPLSPVLGGASSPVVAPINFKFPFGMKRHSKGSPSASNGQGASSPSMESGSPPSPPNSSAVLSRPAKDANVVRKRRISLIPGRQRSPSPAPDVVEVVPHSDRSTSQHGVRRHSSMSYGSISGSSSLSSAGGAIMAKTSSGGSSSQQHKQLGYQKGISTPVLSAGHRSQDEQATPNRFRRRLSSGFAASNPSDPLQQSKRTEKNGLATGQVTPTAHSALERKKSRRVSSKTDCIVM